MKEKIQSALEALKDLHENMDVFEDLSASVKELEGRHKYLLTETDKTSAALADKQSYLDKARQEAVSKHDLEMHNKNQALTSLTAQVQAARGELDETKAQIAAARKQHDDILASIDSLRKRLG